MNTMGDVMGNVLGGWSTVGYHGGEMDGYDMGRARHHGHHPAAHMALPPRPDWRSHTVAPGIHAPREGLELCPMSPDVVNGQFDSTNPTALITYTGRVQRPYRAERLVAFVSRVSDAVAGVPAGQILCQGIFVGTNLQQLTLTEFNVEVFGPTAFGVRMELSPAAPGIDIVMKVRCTVAPTGTQKIQTSLQWLGSSLGT